ncbi:MAG: cytochrome c3 family protein [Syntrophobacteraceae bacterium]
MKFTGTNSFGRLLVWFAVLALAVLWGFSAALAADSHAGRFTAYQGTKTCLKCHRARAVQVHNSEHYQWAGKLGKINDFCIYPDINMIGKLTNAQGLVVDGGCSKCHVGKGAKPAPVTATPTDAQLENIDCLICHAPKYKRTVDPVTKATWVPDVAAMGMPILSAAIDIQKTTRATCLNCHTKAGGGNNFKRGDLEEHHRAPTTRAFDVHMSPASLGGGDLHCTACHKVSNHKIAGKGVDLRIQDGTRPSCTACHTETPPHKNANINNYHLKRVNCTVCHIPQFAKVAPTDMFRDWSAPGDLNATTGLYDPHRTMKAKVTPQYGWWSGKSTFYKFGAASKLTSNGTVYMAGPAVASAAVAGAKIYAFKYHTALQPIDMVSKRLLPLKISQFYMQGDLVNAVPLGQDGVGWPRNPYTYQKTERWMGLFHEVSPKESALGYNNACTTCHGTTTPKVPLKTLGYTIKTGQTINSLCSSCHDSENYSFSAVHPRHVREGYDCSRCHNFSAAN